MFQKITIALMTVLTVAVIILAAVSVGEHRRGNELEARLNDLSKSVSETDMGVYARLDALTDESVRQNQEIRHYDERMDTIAEWNAARITELEQEIERLKSLYDGANIRMDLVDERVDIMLQNTK